MRVSKVVLGGSFVVLVVASYVLIAWTSQKEPARIVVNARDAGAQATRVLAPLPAPAHVPAPAPAPGRVPAPAPVPAGLPTPAPAAPPISKDAIACRSSTGIAHADFVRQSHLCERACKQGDIPSCGMLASNLQLGLGVRRDLPRAVAVYRRVCDSGQASASCFLLGRLLDGGRGVPRDHAAALAVWREGCKQGDRMSCKYLQRAR